ncbi:MAG: 16S rRNA (uracil(1498)-N(3))-methyltransferase [Desulfuromonadales bacterium]|nr:16S rRNA (uracil(1498)-N(3))-methyltransferase [Desulfuromonadales bacterium]NIS43416.1 16S rRNA (uracil(1498)-N(3))-methyltransferase [Desulfuromonadales bacterium]
MRRFFVSPEQLRDESVELDADLLRHLSVLRLREGDEILLFDGTGRAARCRIELLTRRQGRVRCLERWCEEESALSVHLLQGTPKGDKMDVVLQKGVELGLSRITPVTSARSVTRNAGSARRQERWRRIVNEAARQSRRPILPRLDAAVPLPEALNGCDAEVRLLLWEEGARPLHDVLPQGRPASVAILVGPEGGLSAEEAKLARLEGFAPVHLGPRILRTETAALAVTSVLQYLYGDWAQRSPAEAGGGGIPT